MMYTESLLPVFIFVALTFINTTTHNTAVKEKRDRPIIKQNGVEISNNYFQRGLKKELV